MRHVKHEGHAQDPNERVYHTGYDSYNNILLFIHTHTHNNPMNQSHIHAQDNKAEIHTMCDLTSLPETYFQVSKIHSIHTARP